MPKNEKSYSVTQINKYLKAVMDEDFILKNTNITGEVSNFRRNYTGHIYFTLKDEESSIGCVMFSGQAEGLNFVPEDGMKVTASGSISVYVRGGQYQINVRQLYREGKGELFERFERLKSKLLEEGLFDPAHKKPIPESPRRIAVITSLTGAAVRDIISVVQRRNKSIDIAVFPVLVQGDGAAEEISDAIKECNRIASFDTIIIGRGGGSLEDLWAFNEEIVARAVYGSEIPVISAVGHETDFTLADFAADFRAATPSVSAEIAVPLLKDRKELIYAAVLAINSGMERILRDRKRSLETAFGLIDAVSPLNVLKRGYSLTYDKDLDVLIKSARGVKKGDMIVTVLPDGKIVSEVSEIRAE